MKKTNTLKSKSLITHALTSQNFPDILQGNKTTLLEMLSFDFSATHSLESRLLKLTTGGLQVVCVFKDPRSLETSQLILPFPQRTWGFMELYSALFIHFLQQLCEECYKMLQRPGSCQLNLILIPVCPQVVHKPQPTHNPLCFAGSLF